MKRLWLQTAMALGTLALASHPVLGCASCFGKSDSAMAEGMNAGIFVLLAFVLLFWIAFGSFFVFIVRRARQSGESLPGDQDDPQHN
jgi:heme/copper-type cytochrome/quinol oxidase subunit 2